MRLFVLLATIFCLASPALSAGKFMQIYAEVPGPYGHVTYCEGNKARCSINPVSRRRVALTEQRKRDLAEINVFVNLQIKPCTDKKKHGVIERWELLVCANGNCCGDCEEYVLLKRKLLIERGWPASALVVTVVIDELGEGHAILTARTSHGDFILDNKHGVVPLWNETPYRFVMRQSFIDPNVWYTLDPSIVPPADLDPTWKSGTTVTVGQ